MMRLPRLMLASNLPRLLHIVAAVEDDESRVVEIDAADLVTAEPVALCLLASSLARLVRRGQSAVVHNIDPRVKESLERMDVLGPWLHEAETGERGPPQAPIQARRVYSSKDANAVANALARAIASFVPEGAYQLGGGASRFDLESRVSPTLPYAEQHRRDTSALSAG